jgi:hypothetical protein
LENVPLSWRRLPQGVDKPAALLPGFAIAHGLRIGVRIERNAAGARPNAYPKDVPNRVVEAGHRRNKRPSGAFVNLRDLAASAYPLRHRRLRQIEDVVATATQ